MERYEILIVDDEVNSLKVLAAALQSDRYHVDTAQNGEEGLAMLRDKRYHLIISDYRMPGMNGAQFQEKAMTCCPDVPFVMLTAYGTIEQAVNAMRSGAYTYLTKPVNLDLLEEVVGEALTGKARQQENLQANYRFHDIIGKSAAMQGVFSVIRRVAKTDANILILGESGTGKELVARAIHHASLRADKPFIPIDCTTIPSELMESELFGHEKGAFTNAADRKIGLIEMAQGGTIFLDEIGDLEYALEKKLLRFLQEKDILRVGGKQRIKVDARVLSATNRNIEDAVEKGNFRADLYYRLNVITIRIPPLRERREDIPLIANHYLDHFRRKNKMETCGFDEEVMQLLQQYDWPGNVRELTNCVERAVILCPFEHVNIECLPRKLRMLGTEDAPRSGDFNLPEIERRTIIRALDRTGWNQSRAAEMLGISRKQLRTKMKNLHLLKK